jgi:hypothetical protein
VQIPAIEIAIDHLLDIGPLESVLPGEIIIVNLDRVSIQSSTLTSLILITDPLNLFGSYSPKLASFLAVLDTQQLAAG